MVIKNERRSSLTRESRALSRERKRGKNEMTQKRGSTAIQNFANPACAMTVTPHLFVENSTSSREKMRTRQHNNNVQHNDNDQRGTE